MVMKLAQVVPFGRSLDEYRQMFNLSQRDRGKRILGVGDGPASFNAEGTQLGWDVTSIDPIYQLSGEEILSRFEEVVDEIVSQVKATPDDWVWSYHRSAEDLRANRVKVIHKFLEDYHRGKREGRYQIGALPRLNFLNGEYDLALCSHLLFLYSDRYDRQFHYQSILEMLRVSQEVRIFPLLTLGLERSPHLDPLLQELTNKGYLVSIVRVQYELQKGGNEMLVISSNCTVKSFPRPL